MAVESPVAARLLLGVRLVRDDTTGRREARIVETEAYAGPEDRASHARFDSTRRNGIMSGPPGHAYVYLVYGMYDCLNVVTGPAGSPGAVLIRAVEPLTGMDLMRAGRLGVDGRRRTVRTAVGQTTAKGRLGRTPDQALARGPGLVGACFGVDPSWTGTDLCDDRSPLRLEWTQEDDRAETDVAAGPRIGIGYAGEGWAERPWRFWIRDHPSVTRRG